MPVENLLGGEGLMARLRAEFMWGSKAEAAATALAGPRRLRIRDGIRQERGRAANPSSSSRRWR